MLGKKLSFHQWLSLLVLITGITLVQVRRFNQSLWSVFIHNVTITTEFSIIHDTVRLCNPRSGPQWLITIPSDRSSLQTLSLWDWWPSWWPVSPVALQAFTLRKSLRRQDRAFGSVIYSWVSKTSVYLMGVEGCVTHVYPCLGCVHVYFGLWPSVIFHFIYL